MSDPQDSVIYPFYQDYVQWCHDRGIHPECWEVFYNECGKWPTHREKNMQRWNTDMNHRNEMKFTNQRESRTIYQPIQPNDEERAVAEVIRMLGGKS